MNKVLKAVAVLGIALGWGAGAAQAADIPDALTVTIRPNVYYAVNLSTADADLDLGTIDLNTSTFTVKPATVTVESTYPATDLKIQGVVVSGGWTFDADTSNGENNALKAWAIFTDTSVASVPVDGEFDGTVAGANNTHVYTDAAAYDVGDGGGFTGRYTLDAGDPGYKTMEDIPTYNADNAGSRAHLWLKYTLPPSTTNNTDKLMGVLLTANAPN